MFFLDHKQGLIDMKRLLSLIFAGMFLASPAHAQSNKIVSNPAPATGSMESGGKFDASVIAITDEDWKEKWDTPAETVPHFTSARVVPFGKKVFILAFFTNPKLDQSGKADIRCDIQLSDPTGKIALSNKDVSCFNGRIEGSLTNAYLATTVGFVGDSGDPAGTWRVNVVLRDALRSVEVPVHTQFELQAK